MGIGLYTRAQCAHVNAIDRGALSTISLTILTAPCPTCQPRSLMRASTAGRTVLGALNDNTVGTTTISSLQLGLSR